MEGWAVAFLTFLFSTTLMESDTQTVVYAVLAALVVAYLVRWSSHPVSRLTAIVRTLVV